MSFVFFFSSRRRHTRLVSDWSSDVCSSDLAVMHTAAEGAGPVNALDNAVRKALLPHYPELAVVRLVDYKVRIVDEHLGTAAKPRVVVESASGAERWSTMGCSENIIEASWRSEERRVGKEWEQGW